MPPNYSLIVALDLDPHRTFDEFIRRLFGGQHWLLDGVDVQMHDESADVVTSSQAKQSHLLLVQHHGPANQRVALVEVDVEGHGGQVSVWLWLLMCSDVWGNRRKHQHDDHLEASTGNPEEPIG